LDGKVGELVDVNKLGNQRGFRVLGLLPR